MTHDKHGAFDEIMARRWDRYKPPTRPSPGDMAIYQAAMEQASDVLLLGCTPEVRGLARRLRKRLTVVDTNEQVYRALGSLVEGDAACETFVKGDWLEMDFGRRFDLVVGDGSIGMLHPDLHQPLLRSLAGQIRAGGLLMLRATTHFEPPHSTPAEMVVWARGIPQDLYTVLKLPLSALSVDPMTGGQANADFLADCTQLWKQGLMTDAEYAPIEAMLAGDDVVTYRVDPETVASQAAPDFDLEEIAVAGDYLSGAHRPVLVLRRRP